MAKGVNREKVLSSMNDFDDKISKFEKEINSLEYKKQTLLARTVQTEMNLRNWNINNFFNLLDEHDKKEVGTVDSVQKNDNGTIPNNESTSKETEIPKKNNRLYERYLKYSIAFLGRWYTSENEFY